MFDELLTPLRALAVSILGASFAALCYHGLWWTMVLIVIGVTILGLVLDWTGRSCLPGRPVLAVRLMEWWILQPMILAAGASAVAVLITVALTVPDTASAATKETYGAFSAGLTAFFSAVFVSWAGDRDNSKLADHISDAFSTAYQPVFEPGTEGANWVYSSSYKGVDGWGHGQRLKRAVAIAEALRDRAQIREGYRSKAPV